MESRLIMTIIFHLVAIVWIYWELRKKGERISLWFPSIKITYREAFESAIFTGVFSWGMLLLVASGMLAIGFAPADDSGMAATGVTQIAVVIVSGFLAPFFEEIIFRGYLLGKLRANFRTSHAVMLSSLLFALFHLDNVFGAAMFGVIWCLLYLKYKNLWVPVLSHFLYSISNVLFQLSSTDTGTGGNVEQPSVGAVFLMACLFISIGLVWIIPFCKRNWKLIKDI